jgi:hypothetical protein
MNDSTRPAGSGPVMADARRTLDDPVPAPADVHAREAAVRHHQARLNRLFRHSGDGAADRYLLDLMSRYRGIESP